MKRSLSCVVILVAACGDDGVHHLPDAPDGPTPRGLYVTNAGNNAITVYAPNATGDTAPVRTIAGPNTNLSLPIGIITDQVGNLYVANRSGSTVTVYPAAGNGDIPPTRTLMATGLGSPEALAITDDRQLYVSTCPGCGNGAGGQIGVFHFAADALTSDRTLGGATNAATGFTFPGTIALDPANNNLIVGNSFGGSVQTFAPGATGDTAPLRSFASGGGNLQSLAIATDTLFLTFPDGSIAQFPTSATGAAAPASTIPNAAPLTVGYPGGIAVDTSVTPPLIYLVDYGANAVHVIHTAGAAPNLTVASVDTLEGPTTGLNQPLVVRVVK